MSDLKNLPSLLEQRLALIADHEFRDRDAGAHLEALKSVSEEIFAIHGRLRGQIPPRLDHFLQNCSYDKALAFLKAEPNPCGCNS
ncbi:MAG: hypothetical protein R3F11_09385 [Verrucomicrobiales bacterium]